MNAIDTKNRILDEIVIAGTVEEKCLAWNKILDTLEITAGLWSELEYAYKGGEIAEAIRNLCVNEQERQENICQHWKIHHKNAELLTTVLNKVYTVQTLFYNLQYS